jgi:hypothetical protein
MNYGQDSEWWRPLASLTRQRAALEHRDFKVGDWSRFSIMFLVMSMLHCSNERGSGILTWTKRCHLNGDVLEEHEAIHTDNIIQGEQRRLSTRIGKATASSVH